MLCKSCDLTKPDSDFYLNAGKPMQTCKVCRRKKAHDDRRARPEVFSARDAARYVGARREKILADSTVRAKAGGVERRARIALANAVRDGKIDKPDACSECLTSCSRIEGHHEDYSKPLEVIWLCARCHRRLHASRSG